MLNDRAKIQQRDVGKTRQPLLVIDDFLADAGAEVAHAAAQQFTPIGPYYPGIRAQVGADRAAGLLAPLAETIKTRFALDRPPHLAEAYYSLVTAKPGTLAPIQRLPHFDGLEEEGLALLLFLAPSHAGGTAFFRHRSSQIERVTNANYSAYDIALKRDVARHGIPDAAYICGDTNMFEEIALIKGKFNRAIIYRGTMLHCGHIDPDCTFSANPEEGRLTVNLFLQ